MDKKEKNNNIFYALIIGAVLFVFWYMKKNKKEQEGGNADSSGSGSGSDSEFIERNGVFSLQLNYDGEREAFPVKRPKYLGVKHEKLSDYKLKRTIEEYNKILRERFMFEKAHLYFVPYLRPSSEKILKNKEHLKYDYGLFHLSFDKERGLNLSVVVEIGEEGEGFFDNGMSFYFSDIVLVDNDFPYYVNKGSFLICNFIEDGYIGNKLSVQLSDEDKNNELRLLLLEIYNSLG